MKRRDHLPRLLAVENIPALPSTLEEVSRLMDAPRLSYDQIARVILCDQALTVKILRMVNSPLYGFPGRIATLPHALLLLGSNVIRGLMISTVVFDMMNKHMLGLWEHSLACSLCCREIARVTGRGDPEEYAVAGLLHDLGKAVLVLQVPETRDDIEAAVETQDLHIMHAEERILGIDHCEVSRLVADHWSLPPVLLEAMWLHHEPGKSERHPDVVAAVHVGDFLARVFQCGYPGDDTVGKVDPGSMALLGLGRGNLAQVLDAVTDSVFQTIAQYKMKSP